MADFEVTWAVRSTKPAQNQPDEAYPFGIALDYARGAKACTVDLPYPAVGVGTHILVCRRCGLTVGVTAAGRADDPTKVTVPCKRLPGL